MANSATRDRLLEVSSQIKDVVFGKGLLEKKRDALVRSMEGEKRRFKAVKLDFDRLCRQISSIYGLVRAYDGSEAIQLLGLQRSPLIISVEKESLMGCSYLRFSPLTEEKGRHTMAMDPALVSLYMEELLSLVSEGEPLLWEYVTLKSKIQAFERELKKTNLKINTLEYSLLPSLVVERRRIIDIISERERQERFSIKKLTKKKKK